MEEGLDSSLVAGLRGFDPSVGQQDVPMKEFLRWSRDPAGGQPIEDLPGELAVLGPMCVVGDGQECAGRGECLDDLEIEFTRVAATLAEQLANLIQGWR